MGEMRIKMGSNGRMTIPLRLREAMGVKAGDEIILLLEEGTIRMMPYHTAIRLAQETVRRHVPEGTSLVDELLRNRRGEGKRV